VNFIGFIFQRCGCSLNQCKMETSSSLRLLIPGGKWVVSSTQYRKCKPRRISTLVMIMIVALCNDWPLQEGLMTSCACLQFIPFNFLHLNNEIKYLKRKKRHPLNSDCAPTKSVFSHKRTIVHILYLIFALLTLSGHPTIIRI